MTVPVQALHDLVGSLEFSDKLTFGEGMVIAVPGDTALRRIDVVTPTVEAVQEPIATIDELKYSKKAVMFAQPGAGMAIGM